MRSAKLPLRPLALALGLMSLQATAATYQYRVYLPGTLQAPVVTPAEVTPPEVLPPSPTLTLSLAPASLPEAIVGVPYGGFNFSTLLSIQGPNPPAMSEVGWSSTAGLPDGVTLGANGLLAGTPSVSATNPSGTALSIQATYQAVTGVQTYLLPILNPVVTIGTATLPSAKVGSAYSYDLAPLVAVTGDPNYDPSRVSFGASGLPTGLSLGATGVISGTPTATTGASNYQVTATYKGKSGQQVFQLSVGGATFDVVRLSAGYGHTCAITVAGAAYCWGDGGYGQLGNNGTTSSLKPVAVSGLSSGVVDIVAGSSSTCALTSDGALKCWGSNYTGQLGDGSTTDRRVPTTVAGFGSGVAGFSLGERHGCLATTAGAAYCWGSNLYGRLGDGSTTTRTSPVAVSGLSSGVTLIRAGGSQTCAVALGVTQCWGGNTQGQLGDGTTVNRYTPVPVQGLAADTALLSLGYESACALNSLGGVQCWGDNTYGQVGDGTTIARKQPTTVSGLSAGVTDMGANFRLSACVAMADGTARCWGSNAYSQLGDGTVTNRTTPVVAGGFSSGVVSIATYHGQTCVRLASNEARCWGGNWSGQLGNGTMVSNSAPTAVSMP